MEEEICSELAKTSQDSEIRDLNKTSLENTGRESSLCRWSSFTETSIQFAESDSSGNTSTVGSSSVQGSEESRGKASSLSSSRSSINGADAKIRAEKYEDEHHEGYSQDEFELLEESDKTKDSGGELKEEFLDKKLQILRSKKISASTNVKKSQLTLVEPEVQMVYYQNKIHLLNKKQINGKAQHKQEIGDKHPKNIKDEPHQLENARNVERLKVNNILLKMKKENAVPVHQPQKCKKCRKLQGKLAEESYITKKTENLKKQEIEKNIEKHLYEKDSATLIAEIIESGPKPSDPPQEIWDKLLRKGEYS